MAENGTYIGDASFNSLGRDLCWNIYISEFEFKKTLRWIGYDDGYWWSNVSKTDQFQIQNHAGRRYKLNPETNEVFLIL